MIIWRQILKPQSPFNIWRDEKYTTFFKNIPPISLMHRIFPLKDIRENSMHQTDWRDIFKKRSVFFVSPDIKWGLGLEDLSPNYHLICSYYDVLIPVLRKNGVNVFCLQENSESLAKNTANLLEENLVSQYILKNSSGTPYIAFFKPSLKLDYMIKEKKYKKIGNSNTLNEKFENKINLQYLGLAGLKKYLL